jgi:hypothetical protein
MSSGRRAEKLRRGMKRRALKAGAAVARQLLNRHAVRRELSPAPEGSELQPIPGDKGLPILGHALAAATLPIEFLESRLNTYGAISVRKPLRRCSRTMATSSPKKGRNSFPDASSSGD